MQWRVYDHRDRKTYLPRYKARIVNALDMRRQRYAEEHMLDGDPAMAEFEEMRQELQRRRNRAGSLSRLLRPIPHPLDRCPLGVSPTSCPFFAQGSSQVDGWYTDRGGRQYTIEECSHRLCPVLKRTFSLDPYETEPLTPENDTRMTDERL